MRSLLVAMLLLATPTMAAPPGPIWQEGPDGPVYGVSPLHLWPGGVHLPDRVVFDAGSASLDRDGEQIVRMQAQRIRNLPDHEVILFCGWSIVEERALGETLARTLADERCDAVITLYREVDLPGRTYHRRPVSADGERNEELQRSVAVTVVGSAGARDLTETAELLPDNVDYGRYRFDLWDWRIDVPEQIHFKWGSDRLTTNAKAILMVIAEALPGNQNYLLLPTCIELKGESQASDAPLARSRCQRLRDFLLAQGLCETRVVLGPRHAQWKYPNKGPLPDVYAEFMILPKDWDDPLFPYCQ